MVEGKVLNWPILALRHRRARSRSEEIQAELEERRGSTPSARAQAANFEEWCLELMGPILYERYIKPYTEKQWGRPARDALRAVGAAPGLACAGTTIPTCSRTPTRAGPAGRTATPT